MKEEEKAQPKKKNRFGTFFIAYLMVGLVFAVIYAKYYHWPAFGFFSPGFFAVILTWPFQLLGLIKDFMYYGPVGKPI